MHNYFSIMVKLNDVINSWLVTNKLKTDEYYNSMHINMKSAQWLMFSAITTESEKKCNRHRTILIGLIIPHVDMEGVDSINLEPTRPPTCRLVHHANTQKIVKIDSWPVIWQHTVRQCWQIVVSRFLNAQLHVQTYTSLSTNTLYIKMHKHMQRFWKCNLVCKT